MDWCSVSVAASEGPGPQPGLLVAYTASFAVLALKMPFVVLEPAPAQSEYANSFCAETFAILLSLPSPAPWTPMNPRAPIQ